MTAEFTISVNPATSIARLTLVGFFRVADVLAFGGAIRSEYQKLGCGPNRHRTLLDLRAMDIQSQDTLGVFTRLLNDPAHQSERLAIVFSHTLVRRQIARVAANRAATRFFDDMDAAMSWLAERTALAA